MSAYDLPAESPVDWDLIEDPLLHQLLSKAVITDVQLEEMLRQARHGILVRSRSDRFGTELPLAQCQFLVALARQCFLNDYVLEVGDEEHRALQELEHHVLSTLDLDHRLDHPMLALYACYQPLGALRCPERLLRYYDPQAYPQFFYLLKHQLIAPREEAALIPEIRVMTALENDITRRVRRQYEENPFPHWVEVDHHRPMKLRDYLTALCPVLDQQKIDWPDRPRVLIAGCGTGKQAASAAFRYPDASIMAIDISKASLAYGIRQTRELGIDRIEWAQADILELGDFDREFDVIECVGVLHHTADPHRAWRLLYRRLRAGGFFRIGLYSKLARRYTTMAREFCREHGIRPVPADIRKFRRMVKALPGAHPLRNVMRSSDFFSITECRDLVLHPREERYDLKQLAAWLEELDLEFCGFEFPDESAFYCYRGFNPDDPLGLDLSCWHRFEKRYPDTFVAMYQFWARKNPR